MWRCIKLLVVNRIGFRFHFYSSIVVVYYVSDIHLRQLNCLQMQRSLMEQQAPNAILKWKKKKEERANVSNISFVHKFMYDSPWWHCELLVLIQCRLWNEYSVCCGGSIFGGVFFIFMCVCVWVFFPSFRASFSYLHFLWFATRLAQCLFFRLLLFFHLFFVSFSWRDNVICFVLDCRKQ